MTADADQAGPPLGAVLAGGSGTRMDGAKATAKLAGRPLIDYPLRALEQAGLQAVVVAKPETELPELDAPIVRERETERHPLIGVAAALERAGARAVLTVPCDAPLLTPMLLRVLASAGRTTAVRSAGRVHPLIALWMPTALAAVREAIAAGDSATAAIESLDPLYVEVPERETFNVNTHEDLGRAAAIISGASER